MKPFQTLVPLRPGTLAAASMPLLGAAMSLPFMLTAAPAHAQTSPTVFTLNADRAGTSPSWDAPYKLGARARAKKRRARRAAARRSILRRKRKARRSRRGSARASVAAGLLAKARAVPGPLQIVVSLSEQKMAVYKGGQQIGLTRVSTGRASNPTPTGIFSILQKRAKHFSNLYNNAPMPNMQRLTWSGIALHGGAIPGYPASHGCIRQPYNFARALFRITGMNDHVILTRRRLAKTAPRVIANSLLFQSTSKSYLLARLQSKSLQLKSSQDKGVVKPADQAPAGPRVAPSEGPAVGASTPSNEGGKIVSTNHVKLSAAPYKGATTSPSSTANNGFELSARRLQTGQKAMQQWADFEMNLDRMERLSQRPRKAMRILIARRSARDRKGDIQAMLKSLGFDPGPVDGRIGKTTLKAVGAFQERFGLTVTRKINPALVRNLIREAGWTRPPNGSLTVRQGYKTIFKVPVRITNAQKPLGTHLFVAMVAKGDVKTSWTVLTTANTRFVPPAIKASQRSAGSSVSANATAAGPSDAADALARIKMPDFARLFVADRLTSGASMVIADSSYSSETGKYTDFIVETR